MSNFMAKMTKLDFGWGFAPDPIGQHSHRPPIWIFKGPTSKGAEGQAEKGRD